MNDDLTALNGFAELLSRCDDNERQAYIARAKLLAMRQAEPAAFEAPVRTLGQYLDDPIEVPPVLVEPALLVRGGLLCTVGRAGKGKASPHYTRILTPFGFTTMGDIAVGDQVIDPTGGTAKVIGKFPQGIQTAYTVAFSDGATTQVNASHLWKVRDRHQVERLVTTDCLCPGFAVQTVEPFDFINEYERPLDPWLVGFLLGDGYLKQGVMFSTADTEIVARIESLLPTSKVKHVAAYDYRILGGLVWDHVRELGMNTTALHKRVPKAYLRGTYQSRLEVLRGLMDSDGHSSGQFSSMSKMLVEDVIELVRSLGGTAGLQAKRPGGSWRTCVSLKENPFWLPRKADAWKPRTRLVGYRYVKYVDWVGDVEQSCILLDSDSHLYASDDYVVSHNTQVNLNRIMKWSVGRPLFDELTDKDGVHILGPSGPLRILIIENEGSGGMFHRQVGIMLNAEGYLTEEERGTARENILVWGDGGWSGLKLDDEQQLNIIRSGCEQHKPDILFIEPFRGLWRGEENSSTDMANVADALSGIAADFDCGVILTHHEKKSGVGEDGEKMSAARGSTVLEGIVATMENFEVAKGGDYRELSWSKVRYGGGHALLPVRMEWQPGAWWYNHVAFAEIEKVLLDQLAAAHPDLMTVKDLVEATGEKDYSVRRVLKDLTDSVPPRVKKTVSTQGGGLRYRLMVPETDSGDNDEEKLEF